MARKMLKRRQKKKPKRKPKGRMAEFVETANKIERLERALKAENQHIRWLITENPGLARKLMKLNILKLVFNRKRIREVKVFAIR